MMDIGTLPNSVSYLSDKICYKRKLWVQNPDLEDFLKKMEISGKKMRWLESYPSFRWFLRYFGQFIVSYQDRPLVDGLVTKSVT